MPLYITKQSLARIKCDAVVNVTTENFTPLKGIDILFQKYDGSQFLDFFEGLEKPERGEAICVSAFGLPYKFIIHTVANGFNNEEKESQVFESCYKNSLNLAVSRGAESVAISFNSISDNVLRERALKLAVKVVESFLKFHDLSVFLVVPKRTNFLFNKILHERVSRFINRNYESTDFCITSFKGSFDYCAEESFSPPFAKSLDASYLKRKKSISAISEMLRNIDDTFAVTLLKLIDIKGMTDVECYKNANVSKQTWYKILNDKKYKPSKNTVIAFSISLKLNFEETQHLLSTVGFTLSKSSKFDIIIEYFIRNGIYDIMTINETLFEYDQSCLGV